MLPREALASGNTTAVVGAVQRVSDEAAFLRNAQGLGRLMRAHPRPAPERAADWIEYALLMPENGTLATRRPSGDLSFAVLASLAVLAVLAAAGGAMLAALFYAGRALLAAGGWLTTRGPVAPKQKRV